MQALTSRSPVSSMRFATSLLAALSFAGSAVAATDYFSTGPASGSPDTLCDIWQGVYNAWGLSPSADTDNDGCTNFIESIAGTDPRLAGDCIKVGNTVLSGNSIVFTFDSEAGKKYRIVSADSPTAVSWTLVAGSELIPASPNTAQTITITKPVGDRKFYKLETLDNDADGDGVSDWAERKMGMDPAVASSTGNGASDGDTIHSLLTLTASVVEENGYERLDKTAATPVAKPAKIGLVRSFGTMALNNLPLMGGNGAPDLTKVNATAPGSAEADYSLGTVTIPSGQGVTGSPFEVNVNPVQDATDEVPEFAKVTVGLPNVPGATGPSATVCICDADPNLENNQQLYVAFLGREAGVTSVASGLATALVNGDNTSASVSLQFSSLSSAQRSNETYVRFDNGGGLGVELTTTALPNGQVSGASWPILAKSGLITDQATLDALRNGLVFISVPTDNYSPEIKGYFQKATGSTTFDAGRTDLVQPTLPGSISFAQAQRDIYRFLDQSTMGATTALYDEVKAEIEAVDGVISDGATSSGMITGYTNWLNKQMDPAQTPSPNFMTLVLSADNEEFIMRGVKPLHTGGDPQFPGQAYSASYDAFGNLTNGMTAGTNSTFDNNHPFWNNRRQEWWTMVLNSKDQVRQRMATALHEIVVISENDGTVQSKHYGCANYWDMLAQGAFGKYRDLLEKVTYSPMMGIYLSHLRNRAKYVSGGVEIAPDENYAREIMQLFTIGLVLRHPDGSLVLGANGLPIPTYDQTDITELARVMTGFCHGVRHQSVTVHRFSTQGNTLVRTTASVSPQLDFNGVNFTDFNTGGGDGWWQGPWIYPMKVLGRAGGVVYHDFNPYTDSEGNVSNTISKVLFAGKAGETQLPLIDTSLATDVQTHELAANELRLAHNALAGDPTAGSYSGHQNTPVFISRLLLQRYTTANPSPGYLYRVSEVYRSSNGNLGQVLKAILLDYEARSLTVADSLVGSGRMKEPLIHYASLFRGLKAYSGAPLSNLNAMSVPFGPTDSPMWTSYPSSELNKFPVGTKRIRLNDQTSVIAQSPQKAPSVFNWFLPDYVQPGTMASAGLFGPELQINTETNYVNRVNRLYALTWMGLTSTTNAGFGMQDFVSNAGNAGAELVTNRTTLTFDASNWDQEQTVIVTGFNDFEAEGTHTSTISHTVASTDSNFSGIYNAPLTFTITDNELGVGKLVVVTQSGGSTAVTEDPAGTPTDTYTVVLTAAPNAGETVTVTPSAVSPFFTNTAPAASTDVTIAPASISFTEANWQTPQTFTVTANNDAVANNFLVGGTPLTTRAALIRHAVTSGDADYNTQPVSDFLASVTDNDSGARLIITESNVTTSNNAFGANGIAVITEGSTTDTFTVVFAAGTPPSANVTVTMSYDSTRLTPSGGTTSISTPGTATLTFTPGNYTTAQTITLTAVNDTTRQGVQFLPITFTTSSTDTSYAGLTLPTLQVRVNDNDEAATAGITLIPYGGAVRAVEGGMTGQYLIVCNKAPDPTSATITQAWTGNSGDVSGVGSPTFNLSNWFVPQTVTVTANDDFLIEGSHTSRVTYTGSGGGYSNVDVIAMTIGDNDLNSSAGITVTPSGGSTTVAEGGATDSFDVVLTGAPSSNVTFTFTATPAQATLSGATLVSNVLTFTPGNWNVPQTVTVTATDDAVSEGTITAAISSVVAAADTRYSAFVVADIPVTITDNETGARIVLTQTGGSTEATEGGATDTFSVALASGSAPASNVTVTLATGGAQSSVSPTTLTFTPGNYTSAQSVTLTATDDATTETAFAETITASTAASGPPAGFTSLSSTLAATINDNDDLNNGGAIAILQTNTNARVVEGGQTDTFEVYLRRAPTADVTLTPSFGTANQVTLSPATLTFTALNWSVPQTVTITAVDDAAVENNHSTTITYAANGAGGYVVQDTSTAFTATIGDNEATSKGFIFSTTSITATEGGATGVYTVRLRAAPTANVVVTPSFVTGSQATVSPTTLTFTTGNFASAQTFTVTATNDAIAEPTQVITMTHAATSSDAAYTTTTHVPDVTLTLSDNDAATAGRILAVQSGGDTVLREDVGTDTLEVSLTGPVPASDVTVTVGRVNSNFQFIVNGATATSQTLTFTPANYTTAQTVNLVVVNDASTEAFVTNDAVSLTTAASGPPAGYTSLSTSVPVRIYDNDNLGRTLLTLTHSGGTTRVVEGGITDSYSVVLRRAPTANVTLACAYNPTQITLSATDLIFTPANWNVPQVVTVTAVDDPDVEGAHTAPAVNYTASNTGGYIVTDAVNTGTIAIGDNDSTGYALVNVVESSGFTWLAEGTANTDTYTVALGTAPKSDVTITPQAYNALGGTNLVTFSAPLVFTPSNWSTPQTVTITLTASATNNNNRAVFIGNSITTTDPVYANYGAPSVNAIIADANETTVAPAILATGPNTIVNEAGTGNTDTVYVYLRKAPTSGTVNIVADANAQFTTSPASLNFTTTNWNQPQLLTITSVNDSSIEASPHTSTLTLRPSAAVGGYATTNTATHTVNINDNDQTGQLVITPAGTTIAESGNTTYTVKLSGAPTGTVTVTIVTQKHARPNPNLGIQMGYFASSLPGSSQQKDNLFFDWSELTGIYTTAYTNARGAAAESVANAPAGHLAGTKAVIDHLDLLWCGGRMKALWPDGSASANNPRQPIIEAIYNSYSLTTLSTASGTTFSDQVRDRVRFAAYLVSISPPALAAH